MKTSAALAMIALLFGCGEDLGAVDEGGAPPTDPAALEAWLLEGRHSGWEAEPEVRDRGGFSGARVFVNASLGQTLVSGGAHDVGAAAVRELYEADLRTLRGFAVVVKVSNTGHSDDWYFYEQYLGQDGPQVAETAAAACLSCHAEGQDHIRSRGPLIKR
jgi:hypothetical protein